LFSNGFLLVGHQYRIKKKSPDYLDFLKHMHRY